MSDREIKIGNIMPYSGPASAYGIVGKTMSAYFRMINDNGGINGRRITFISYDDAYSPPKTVEQARKLVESDEVLLIFAPLGTATNAAIQKYMNTMRVPQIFVLSGASRWGDPSHFPWTIGLQPNYRAEARVYAAYILEHYPNARIGLLYQNDDFGQSLYKGVLASGLKPGKVITYDPTQTDFSPDAQQFKSAGVDGVIILAIPKPTRNSPTPPGVPPAPLNFGSFSMKRLRRYSRCLATCRERAGRKK